MSNNVPVYLPGDTINFWAEVQHNLHLGDAWAAFRLRQQAVEAGEPIHLGLNAEEIVEARRVGTELVSTVLFQATVLRSHRPGDYDLETIRALPLGVERDARTAGIDLGAPAGVSFRIAPEPDEPTGRVLHTRLEVREGGRRYFSRT